MRGQGWDLRLLRRYCGAPQGTAPRHGGTGGVQGPPRKQNHGGVEAAGPSGFARVLLERHCPVEHHLGRNRGSAHIPMAGRGCLQMCVQAASLPPSHRAHLPLLTVGIHGEVAQALKLELVKGLSRVDRAVDQGIVHHTQGVLAGGTAQPASLPFCSLHPYPLPSSPQLLFPPRYSKALFQEGRVYMEVGASGLGARRPHFPPRPITSTAATTYRVEVTQKATRYL